MVQVGRTFYEHVQPQASSAAAAPLPVTPPTCDVLPHVVRLAEGKGSCSRVGMWGMGRWVNTGTKRQCSRWHICACVLMPFDDAFCTSVPACMPGWQQIQTARCPPLTHPPANTSTTHPPTHPPAETGSVATRTAARASAPSSPTAKQHPTMRAGTSTSLTCVGWGGVGWALAVGWRQ